jgi:PKD repeat protein
MKRVNSSSHIMRVSSRLLISPVNVIILTTAVLAIAVILLASNITLTYAQQQQQQPLTGQSAVTQNGTTVFQSTADGVRLEVPEGWVINDVNNTGSTLSEETTQGYGILAQLCPEEEEQQAAVSNVSGSGDTANCQGIEGEVIHIVRYLDLDARLQAPNNTAPNSNNLTIDNILSYHLQKLGEVGYSITEIVNSIDTTLNVINAQTNQTIATIPAKNVEMTYSTSLAPNQTRTGYFVLTATNATAPNQGMTKGYSIFYEGNSAATAETTTTAAPSSSLAATPLPAPIRQVFDSFELVTAVVAPPIEPLTVEITSDTEEGDIVPATFEFEANVTGGTGPYAYSWDFDDEGNGEDDEQTVSHTFEEAGSYDVDLTVIDTGGQNASDSIEVTVEEAPIEEEEEEEEEASPAEEIIEDVIEEEEEEEPPADEGGDGGDDNEGGTDNLGSGNIDVDAVIENFREDIDNFREDIDNFQINN